MRLLLLALLGFLCVFIKGVRNEHQEVAADSEIQRAGTDYFKVKDKREAKDKEQRKARPRKNKKKKKTGNGLRNKKQIKRKSNNGANKKGKINKQAKNDQKGKPQKGKRKNQVKKEKKGKPKKGKRNKSKNEAKKERNKNKKQIKRKSEKGGNKKFRRNKQAKRAKKGKPKRSKRKKPKNEAREERNKDRKKVKVNQRKQRQRGKSGYRKNKSGKNKKKSGRKENKSATKKNKPGRQANGSCCVEKLAEYAKLFEGKAGVVIRQYKRIQSFESTVGGKMSKKGNFNSSYKAMLGALGGNSSSPHCDGQTIGSNSTSKTYKDALSTLNTCESTVNSNCPNLLTTSLNSTLTACYKASQKFRGEFSACLNKTLHSTQESICDCVGLISASNVVSLKACDTDTQVKKQKKQKKKCVAKFQKCKKAQDTTVEGLDTCKKPYKCGGALNPKDAKEQIDLATKIKDALYATEKCHGDAMASLNLTAGTGDNGAVPSNTGRLFLTRRVRQAADGKGCEELEKLWEAFNKSADATAQKFSDDLKQTPAENTTNILAAICARNLTADLASCAKESRQITVTVTVRIIRIRIYIFWCRQWLLLIELKITVITATFGLPAAPAPATTSPPATVATKRTARRMVNAILKEMKNKL